MDEFLVELSVLDETQDRVEAVSDEIQCAVDAAAEDDGALARAMVDEWIQALRTSDFQSERIAFLYVANHVLQKNLVAPANRIVALFGRHLEEAVALVCNSPMDRLSAVRLLELWHEKAIFTDSEIFKMWKCTGEDLPDFLTKLAGEEDASMVASVDPSIEDSHEIGSDLISPHVPAPALPQLNAHAANPVLNVLKKIDRHKSAIQYLEQSIRAHHQYVLTQAGSRYASPEDLLNDHTTPVSLLKQRVEGCLRLVKTRNAFLRQIPSLEAELKAAVTRMIADEESAVNKNEQRQEQCDMIDIGLADLSEHREKYPNEARYYLEELWAQEAYACQERRRRREEESRQRDEEMARLQQTALAESAAHAVHLEADITGEPSALQALAKDYRETTHEAEEKAEPANEMVWHPVLRELVPLQSQNVEWETWRDH